MPHDVHPRDVLSTLAGRIEALGLFHLRFVLRTRGTLRLPERAGPTLRGAFGRALLTHLCPLPAPRCARCEWVAECAYGRAFETPQAALHPGLHSARFAQPPHPLWLRWDTAPECVVPPGRELQVGVLGTIAARPFLPEVARAVRSMAAEGLGHHRVPLELIAIEDVSGPEPVGIHTLADLPHARPWRPAPATSAETVILRTCAPLRIHRGGRLLANPEAVDVAAAAWRRLAMLDLTSERPLDDAPDRQLHDELMSLAHQSAGGSSGDLRMIRRRSGRTGLQQSFLGFEGEIVFRAPAEPLRMLLEVGTRTGIGKGTAFGFGHYQLESRITPSALHG